MFLFVVRFKKEALEFVKHSCKKERDIACKNEMCKMSKWESKKWSALNDVATRKHFNKIKNENVRLDKKWKIKTEKHKENLIGNVSRVTRAHVKHKILTLYFRQKRLRDRISRAAALICVDGRIMRRPWWRWWNKGSGWSETRTMHLLLEEKSIKQAGWAFAPLY